MRDTPYNLIHIRNMETVTLAGGIICPASPSFYSKPATIEAVAATVVDRVLDLAGIDIKTFRWGKKWTDELRLIPVNIIHPGQQPQHRDILFYRKQKLRHSR